MPCKTEINYVDVIAIATANRAYKKVCWFDITMDEVFGMQKFDTVNLKL